MARIPDKDKAILVAAFARIDPASLAVALGSVLGLTLYIATAVLLIKTIPPGTTVGPHLALLAIYLPGYEVSWLGALLGAAYFWAMGAIAGFILANLWNLTHHIYVAVIVIRAMWWKLMAE